MSSTANATLPLGSAQPLSVLDVFLPGLTHTLAIADQLLAGELSYYAYFLCLIGIFMYLGKYIRKLAFWLEPYFTSTIHVRPSDETFDMFMTWVKAHKLAANARSSCVQLAKEQKMGEGTKKALDYVPWTGSFLFWYQGQPISYRNTLVEAGFRREEQISLTCLGRSSRVLRALMDECLREYLARSERKTAIFEHREDRWIRMGSRNTRPLSTVIVNEKVKKSMVDDVKEFLEPVSRLWYTKKSMAYRRGYLLSGPPGTGKSSLCFSVAGEFDLDIYIVSIPSVSDRYLRDLFDKLPEKCMVLLEDVDAAGISRLNTESDDFKQSTGLLNPGQTLTLSGLLNRLDGVSSPEGRVVVMTTNHAEKLDEALTRPGRVDRKIEFELADKDVISSLFSYVYEEPDGVEDAGGSLDIKGQSTRFAESVPPSMFSQAEVLSYLMQYKDRPDEALRDCQAWVDAALQSKATLERGNSWNHCN